MNPWGEVVDHDDDLDDLEFVCPSCGWDAGSYDGLNDHLDWHDHDGQATP